MSVWKYIPTDKHEYSHLVEVQKYYSTVGVSMRKSLDYALSFSKYGLPNWRTEILRRTMGWEDAAESYLNVTKAIENHPNYP